MAKVKADPIDLLMAQYGLTTVPPAPDPQPTIETLPPPDPTPEPVSIPTPDDWQYNES